MLLKILILAVIAWFILRAAKNLITAVARGQGIPESRQDDPRGRSPDRPTVVRRHPDAAPGRPIKSDESNVEDARFRDL